MSSEKKTITLKTSDGEDFKVDAALALESLIIKFVVKDVGVGVGPNGAIPVPFTSSILHKVFEYCSKHVIDVKEGKVSEKENELSPEALDELVRDAVAAHSAAYLASMQDVEFLDAFSNAWDAIEDQIFKKHINKASEPPLKSWEADFVKVEPNVLFDIIMAADFLNIQGLLDLTTRAVADMVKGKTPEEIRQHFNIKNDFTPEEEEEIRRENQWAFEWCQGLSIRG